MGMATDTAAPEVDTAAVAVEAPPVEVVETSPPETAQTPAPDTEPEAASETVVVDPLAGIDPALLFEHPEVKARLARETESVRRQQERATETRINEARSNWVASGQAFTDVQSALAEGNTQQAQQIINATLANRDWAAVAAVDRIGRSKLPEGKVATEDIDRLDAALAAAQRGTGTLDQYADTLIEVRAKAYAENVLAPQIEQRMARENATKQKAAAKTAEIQSAEATNDAQGRPTVGVPGQGASGRFTAADLAAMPDGVFARKPPEEQARLIREAREDTARRAGR